MIQSHIKADVAIVVTDIGVGGGGGVVVVVVEAIFLYINTYHFQLVKGM